MAFSPSRAIEIHDSILERISVSRGQAQLHFSCIYIHHLRGEPGRDAGSVTAFAGVLSCEREPGCRSAGLREDETKNNMVHSAGSSGV